jgi:hypothetical protein
MSGIHRLAAHKAITEGKADMKQITQFHDKLSRTLGGDYWKEILLENSSLDTKTKEVMLIEQYRNRLSSSGYLNYTGACPVLQRRDSATKYYMVFASGHPHAIVKMNDAMCTAFNEYMNDEETKDTMFAGLHWTAWHNFDEFARIIKEYVLRYPGKSRSELFPLIVKDHFMRFTESEYKKSVTLAVQNGLIDCSTPYPSTIRRTKALNDQCILMPMQN